jgi:hypothetical protein
MPMNRLSEIGEIKASREHCGDHNAGGDRPDQKNLTLTTKIPTTHSREQIKPLLFFIFLPKHAKTTIAGALWAVCQNYASSKFPTFSIVRVGVVILFPRIAVNFCEEARL